MVVAATAASGAITLQIDAGSPLASIGGAALVDSSRRRFLVSRTGQDTFASRALESFPTRFANNVLTIST